MEYAWHFEFPLNLVILAAVIGTLCGLAAVYFQKHGLKFDVAKLGVAKLGAFCGKWGIRLGFIYLGYVFMHFVDKYW